MNQPAHLPTPAPAVPNRVGQGTAVEQSRAAAEVQAAVVVAQQCPRNMQAAVAEMRESCKQQGLAERAFFRYSRGGSTVTGASVHLARELARCWGNVQYGLVELRRDDDYGQSEMQAFAWDVQTNSRNSSTFIVPHRRDTKNGAKQLTDMRDIYENNANNGARRVREAIFAILPPWFVEEAKALCSQTLKDGGGKPLHTRIADAVKVFERFGVTTAQLEQKIGRPTAKWNEHDVAQLGVIFKSLDRGEVAVEDEFPPERVTADELTGGSSGKAATKRQQPANEPDPNFPSTP
ncbi:hypothetical protein [Streptomyces aculeolatus]|uniref:hypothetical protein n=1 Tax=Streptomyces aculeolatus TaxID=270689 RepID=UPI001CEC268C|nr:hypothetical protein [Streptomyces aculeolatus]